MIVAPELDKTFIRLTLRNDDPLFLRRTFIRCVTQEEKYTRLCADAKNSDWYVKEPADSIDAPRCTVHLTSFSGGLVKVDPHAIVAIEGETWTKEDDAPPEESKGKIWPFGKTRHIYTKIHYTQIHMRIMNNNYERNIKEKAEDVHRIVNEALSSLRL